MTILNKSLSSLAMRAWLFVMRQDMKLSRVTISRLQRKNTHSTKTVVDPLGPVVSLTTFGDRLSSVHLTIESIGSGKLLPSRLILWIQDPKSYDERPESLRRLEARGLEVRLTENYGPHSKYYPYLLSQDVFHGPLVTADDDVLYSRWWLSGLVNAHNENPGTVNCYRAHVLQIVNGAIAPYLSWKPCKSTEPFVRNFATGGSGCIYPSKMLTALKLAGSSFLDVCRRADDVWLHVNALRSGFKVRQIGNRPLNFASIPGTQSAGLFQVNAALGGNDEQIHRTYLPEDIELLEAGHRSKTNADLGATLPRLTSSPE